jgi:ribonuclease HII
MKFPNLKEEKKLWKKGFKRVVGLDEAGRGPLAGPVVAAAVLLRSAKFKIQTSRSAPCNYGVIKKNLKLKILLREVKDSKKLTAKKREELYKILIRNFAIEWGIGKVSEKMIDKINILEATKLAMRKAIEKLKPDFLILDGNFKINSRIPQKPIIKADQKVFSCAAASIIAKVARDKIMVAYHKKYPQYGFKKHKGYPTKFHFRVLKKYGSCKIHRKTFWPVIKYVNIAR